MVSRCVFGSKLPGYVLFFKMLPWLRLGDSCFLTPFCFYPVSVLTLWLSASDLLFGVVTKTFSLVCLLNNETWECRGNLSCFLQGSNQMEESVFAALYLDSNRCAGSSHQSNYVFFVWIQHVRMLFVLKRASAPFHPLALSPAVLQQSYCQNQQKREVMREWENRWAVTCCR